jgi:protease-4
MIGRVLAVIGALTLVFIVAIFLIATFARAGKGTIASKTILEIDLETELREQEPNDPFARLAGKSTPVLRDIVDALEKARTDDRVAGLIAHMGAAPLSMAQAQEIRDAVLNFRSGKKFAVAFSETFGEFGPGNSAYYLATGFDEIYLQPSGDIGLTGLRMEAMFLRGTFDKLGMVPRFDQRYEYKSAMNTYTDKKMTPAFREAMDAIIQSMYGQVVRGIASGRKISEESVKAAVDQGPILGKAALPLKLVDGVAYRDEVFEKVKAKAGSGSQLLYLQKYLDRAGRPHTKGPVVALIYGDGAVMRGKSSFDPLGGSSTMGSDTVAGAFRDAIRDKDVKAILFRVDSPGGSYVASDAIWRETKRARQAGKPLIVSMSSVAGSGGYFVAMAADKIVAQPGTITGSIGVLGGKFVMNGLFDKLGLSFDDVERGQHAGMFSSTEDFSPDEWAKFQAWLDRVYQDFTTKVAEGRKLPKEKVLEIAKGRIWTGEDAKKIGLVDELGGYPTALKLVKEAIKETGDVRLRIYPKQKSTVEALMAQLTGEEQGESSESAATVSTATLGSGMEELRPVLRLLKALSPREADAGVLAMPPVRFVP